LSRRAKARLVKYASCSGRRPTELSGEPVCRRVATRDRDHEPFRRRLGEDKRHGFRTSGETTGHCLRQPPRDDALANMNEYLISRVAEFLDPHHVMSLATVGEDGPHAANLFYARDGCALIWVSDPASRHSRHIEERTEVAATIARDCCDFPDVQGPARGKPGSRQSRGALSVPAGPLRRKVTRRLRARAFLSARPDPPSVLRPVSVGGKWIKRRFPDLR
jgi:pyridoxamine 5'-phosphate oxidase-like protein